MTTWGESGEMFRLEEQAVGINGLCVISQAVLAGVLRDHAWAFIAPGHES